MFTPKFLQAADAVLPLGFSTVFVNRSSISKLNPPVSGAEDNINHSSAPTDFNISTIQETFKAVSIFSEKFREERALQVDEL